MQDDWERKRQQSMRKEALEISRKLHQAVLDSLNSRIALPEEEKEENGMERKDLHEPSVEEVIDDADKIYNYILKEQKVYKD